jgi:L-ascorbate metabolism protein UlaG (beta-lactamase superfamily)
MCFLGMSFLLAVSAVSARAAFEKDTITTSGGDLVITFVGHGSLMMEFDNKVIHIDPSSAAADYSDMPKADIILLTHHHGDHLDKASLMMVRTRETDVILTEKCTEKVSGGIIMDDSDTEEVKGIKIKSVPAYNLVHRRDNGQLFHPPGEGNGYILTFGDTRVYVAGDTENIPEMKKLKDIDIAFLPMNLPYTMTPEMVADAVKGFRPKILYPYHYGKTDPARIVELLKGEGVEVRIRTMP